MDKQIMLEDALRRDGLSFDQAVLTAAEILACYPAELQEIALEWAETGEIPDKTINNMELIKVHKTINHDFISTLRLLHVFVTDPRRGYILFQVYARRSPRR